VFGVVCFAKNVSSHTADSKKGGQWYTDTFPLVFSGLEYKMALTRLA